jgi:hypothetical protein
MHDSDRTSVLCREGSLNQQRGVVIFDQGNPPLEFVLILKRRTIHHLCDNKLASKKRHFFG